MSVYTLEVAGRPVACIRAETQREAEQAASDPGFRDGLLGLAPDAAPAGAGEAELRVRGATAEEEAQIAGKSGQTLGGTPDGIDRPVFFLPAQPGKTPGAHRLILANRVEHTPVYDQAGQRIGHIEDLSIDRRSGEVVYAIMSFGGFLGIGKRFHPIPWNLLHYEPESGGYVVPLDQATLANAPHYGAEELGELGGSRQDDYGMHILEYYGRMGLPII